MKLVALCLFIDDVLLVDSTRKTSLRFQPLTWELSLSPMGSFMVATPELRFLFNINDMLDISVVSRKKSQQQDDTYSNLMPFELALVLVTRTKQDHHSLLSVFSTLLPSLHLSSIRFLSPVGREEQAACSHREEHAQAPRDRATVLPANEISAARRFHNIKILIKLVHVQKHL